MLVKDRTLPIPEHIACDEIRRVDGSVQTVPLRNWSLNQVKCFVNFEGSSVFRMWEREGGLGDRSPPVGSRGSGGLRPEALRPPEAEAFLLMNA